MIDLQTQLEGIKRGVVDLISEEELVKKLKEGRPLRVKAGFDPTAPDLHLGHAVLLKKLRQFQNLGHQVIFLIGDFTAKIGDPSGRNVTRPGLSEKELRSNIKTYEKQAFQILDRSSDRLEIRYNSEWMGKFSAEELIRLAQRHTVARMLERDDFAKRHKAGVPIAIPEFLYPLIQGYDSFKLQADIEIGGTDQKFNLLMGREVQRDNDFEPQVIMTLPLLVGTDGVQKMSKSYGNSIGIMDSAADMVGKIMSLSDELMWSYYELLSDYSLEEIKKLQGDVRNGVVHPKEAKMRMAIEIATFFHGKTTAQEASRQFDAVFGKKKEVPKDIEEVSLPKGTKVSLVDLLADLKLAPSKSEARRLIHQNAVTVNERKITEVDAVLGPTGEYIIKVGKRRFKKVRF